MSRQGKKVKGKHSEKNSELDTRGLQKSFDLTAVADVDLKQELAQMHNLGIDLRNPEMSYQEQRLLNVSDLSGHIRRIVAKNGIKNVDKQVLAILSDAIQMRLLDTLEDMRDLSIQRVDARKCKN